MSKLKTHMASNSPQGAVVLSFHALIESTDTLRVIGTITSTQEGLLKMLASYRDIYYSKVDLAHHDEMRAATAMHVINHVMK